MHTVGGSGLPSGLRFPGRVRSVQRAQLAFNVPGQVVEFPAEEGMQLRAGDLIARIDPEKYELRLSSARAQFDKARVDYERVRTIWEKNQAVARAEVDRKKTAMEVARATYAAALQEFEDTRLTAPFAGVVARRYVENFQNVQAKEPIVSLQDMNELEIVIQVPERIMRSEPRRAVGYARFENLPDRRFPVTLKTYATDADPQTQTYDVILGLVPPQDVKILPGMSAEVLPAETDAAATGEAIVVPLRAVTVTADEVRRVWVVHPETSRVSPRAIETGPVQGDDIVVTDGLAAGERIVVAGLGQLRDGMLVRPLDP